MPKKAHQPTSNKNIEKIPNVKPETKSVKPVKPVEPVVLEEEQDVVDDSGVENESKSVKCRNIPTKDSVIVNFEEIIATIDQEIERLRESQQKSKGVKFLRSLGKKVKTLKGYAVRVMKQKQKTNRKNNTNSGFLKPVKISSDMAKFTGWKPEDLKSRVEVTKYLCNYIRENNLQNPEDRRQIIADKKLTKLLGYKEGDEPLTYYRIQTYMKKHFINPDSVPVTSVSAK